MLAQPEKAAAAKSSRKPSSLVSGSPYHVSSCYPASGGSVSPRRGWVLGGGGSSPCENPNPRGPLSRVWVSIATCFFFPLFFLFHIFVVVFVSVPASTSIRSLSLSLSLTSTSRCLLYLSIFSVRISSSVSAKKQRPVQS
jgi:hypothetical protein